MWHFDPGQARDYHGRWSAGAAAAALASRIRASSRAEPGLVRAPSGQHVEVRRHGARVAVMVPGQTPVKFQTPEAAAAHAVAAAAGPEAHTSRTAGIGRPAGRPRGVPFGRHARQPTPEAQRTRTRYEGVSRSPEAGGGLSDVLSHLNTSGRLIMQGLGSTKALYSPGRSGRYELGRLQAVHIPYLTKELEGHQGGRKHIEVMFTSGGSASSKSWLTKNQAPEDAVIMDADRAKEAIPEFRRLVNSGNMEVAASGVHEESSDMSKVLAAIAMDEGYNLVVDTLGDSKPGSFAAKVQAAIGRGADVRVEHMHLDVEEALRREKVRAAKKGRKVKEGVLRNGHASAAASMADIALIPGVRIRIWSSAQRPGDVVREGEMVGRSSPKLIAEGVGSAAGLRGLTILDRQLFAEFLQKGGSTI